MQNDILSPFGKIVWEDRYALKDENSKLIEKNIFDTFRRVSTAIALKEKDPEYWGDKFYQIMADQLFCPAGRVLAHAGTHYSQLLNCFVLPFKADSLEEIMNTTKNMAIVQKYGGGCIGGESNVLTNKGPIPLKEIVEGNDSDLKVLSFDPDSYEMEYCDILERHTNDLSGDRVFEIEFDNIKGGTVARMRASDWHPFFVFDGSKIIQVRADELKAGMAVIGPTSLKEDYVFDFGSLGDSVWAKGTVKIAHKYLLETGGIVRSRDKIREYSEVTREKAASILRVCGKEEIAAAVLSSQIVRSSKATGISETLYDLSIAKNQTYVASDPSIGAYVVVHNTGFNFSRLRPSGSYIKGVNGRSSGIIGFISMMSTVSEVIEQGGCFISDTLVATIGGPKKIKDLRKGEYVYSMSDRGFILSRCATDAFLTKRHAEVWRVKTNNNLNIYCTKDHPFMPQEGFDFDQKNYIQAKDLKKNIPLMSFSDDVVKQINKGREYNVAIANNICARYVGYSYQKDVWNVEIENTHNFVVCDQSMKTGVVVSNTRRGANIGLLEVWHPDIWEFISYKTEHNWECLREFIDVNDFDKWESFKYENLYKWQMFNVSVGITDEFLIAVEEEKEWPLKWDKEEWLLYTVIFKKSIGEDRYKEFKFEVMADCDKTAIWKTRRRVPYPTSSDIFEVVSKRKVKASEIWDRLCYNAWADGCPGIINLSTARKMHNLEYCSPIEATNPCGEQLLGPNSSCNLSSILLPNFVINKTKSIDWSKLKDTVHTAVRFADNVLDNCTFPLSEIGEIAHKERRVGIGTMGVHDMLIKMELDYDSEEGRTEVEDVLEFIRDEAYRASIEIGEEKGQFPAFERKKFLRSGFIKTLPVEINKLIDKKGIRNGSLLSQAPTGSISALNNLSSGCEPWYSLSFQRNTRLGSYEDGCKTYIEWKKENPGKSKPSYFKTAQEIAPEDHVKMLTLFTKYIDSSVSKCVTKGTMIVTSNGIVPIESMSDFKYSDSDTFSGTNKNYLVIDENGALKKVLRHYYGGKKSCFTVRFNNGFKLTAAKTHLLKTVEGWKSLNDLKKGDIVLYRVKEMALNKSGYVLIKQKPDFRNHIKRDFPSYFTEDFAEFLGAWLADGSCNCNSISICKKDDIVIKRLVDLFRILFGVEVKPCTDKRNGVKSLVVNSRAFVKYFKENYGSNAQDKRVPMEIMISSHKVQKAFLKGISMDGYIKGREGTLVVYDGYSKQIAESISYMLSSLGVRYYLGKRKVKGGKLSNQSYNVVAYLLEKGIIDPIESHKKLYSTDSSGHFQVYVPDEVKNNYRELPPAKSENYYSFRNLRKSLKKKSSVRESLLKKLNVPVDYNLSCIEITDIEEVGVREVYDIEVEDTHSYLINGIVSHNTVNLPNSATVQTVKDTFLYAMENGVKGITIFRDGSKEGVLVDKTKKKDSKTWENVNKAKQVVEKIKGSTVPFVEEKDDYENVMSPKKRGDKTVGSTYRIHMQNHNLYVTVNRNKDGELVEIFTTVGESKNPNAHHTSGVEDSWAEGLGKIISLALRAGVKPSSIIRNLKNIPSDKPVFTTIGDRESSEHIPSPPHAIARVVEEELLERDELIVLEGGNCTECGSTNTEKKSSTCYECKDCGYSGCS